jgi:DNA ligase D
MVSPSVEMRVGDRTVTVTNPDRVIFPAVGVTKIEVVRYYVAVAGGVMRATRDRPVTLQRCPSGLGGPVFYNKHAPKGRPPWVTTAHVTYPSGRTGDQVCVTELATLAWAAQMGTLDLHPWPVRSKDTDHPDELRIDLDPQPGTSYADAVVAAGEISAVLADAGMVGYPKTSGSRGVHVLVRIEPSYDFTAVRRAGIAVAREVERRRPDLITTSWWKEDRGERVFCDFNQNARDRTTAATYSVRSLPLATVSAPLRWDELADAAIEDLTVRTVPQRYADIGDPHATIDDVAFPLETLLEMADRDARDRGLGDLPYPPDYPKMPGEPKRVQPSKAR